MPYRVALLMNLREIAFAHPYQVVAGVAALLGLFGVGVVLPGQRIEQVRQFAADTATAVDRSAITRSAANAARIDEDEIRLDTLTSDMTGILTFECWHAHKAGLDDDLEKMHMLARCRQMLGTQ